MIERGPNQKDPADISESITGYCLGFMLHLRFVSPAHLYTPETCRRVYALVRKRVRDVVLCVGFACTRLRVCVLTVL